jgi:hypothetical protein
MGLVLYDRCLAAHDSQQNLSAPLGGEPLQHTQDLGEGTGDHASGCPGLRSPSNRTRPNSSMLASKAPTTPIGTGGGR